MRFRHLFPLLICAATAIVASEESVRCGFNPLTHRRCEHPHGVAGRGVNDIGGEFAIWVNQAGVFPTPPDQKTVVTYSFVSATEIYSNNTLDPIVDADFIGAETQAVIREGVESWNDVGGLVMQFVPSGGKIRIGSAVQAGGQVGLGGFSAASQNGGRFFMTTGFLQLDRSDGSWTADVLRAVAAHEVGHALGMNHTSDSAALMAPSVNSSTGPLADDRFYFQFMYGSAPAKLSASASQANPVSLSITRAAPKQSGTDSSPTFDGSFNTGNGTGTKTQNDVVGYIVERKRSGDATFTVLTSTATAPAGGQNADGQLSHVENSFTFSDSTATTDGTYIYRVKAVHATPSTTEPYSAEVSVAVAPGNGGGNGGGGNGGGNGGGGSGETADTDGDGFPDIVETAAGTSPTDVSQTPFAGVPATNSQPLTVTKLTVGLNFKLAAKDAYSIAGTIPANDTLLLENQTAILDLAGLVRVFLFNAKGQAVSGDSKAKMGSKPSKGEVKYSFAGSKGSIQDAFDEETMTSRDSAKTGDTVTLVATVYFNGVKYTTPVSALYKSKIGKSGKASRIKP